MKVRVLIQTMNERPQDAVGRAAKVFLEYIPEGYRAEFGRRVTELAARGQ